MAEEEVTVPFVSNTSAPAFETAPMTPAVTESSPLERPLPIWSVAPASIVVPPVQLFAPTRVSVAAPRAIRLPAPLRTPP